MSSEAFSSEKFNTNFLYNSNDFFKPYNNYLTSNITSSYKIANFLKYFDNNDFSIKNANKSLINKDILPSIDINKPIIETEKIVNYNFNNYNNINYNILLNPFLSISYINLYNIFVKKYYGEENKIYKEKKKYFYIKKIKKNKVKKANKKSYSSRQDNDRVKFVRQTLNFYLYNKLTNIIKLSKIKQKLKKFPEKLINEIAKLNNKKYLNLTLEDFYTRRELYNSKELLKHFEYNLVIINHLKDEKNKIFLEKYGVEALLKMKFIDLIRIYLQSEQFQQKINELNENKGAYLSEKFKYFANNFINNYLD